MQLYKFNISFPLGAYVQMKRLYKICILNKRKNSLQFYAYILIRNRIIANIKYFTVFNIDHSWTF